MKKPEPKDFGFQEKESFDHEHGWMIEGGEEAYYKADSEYQEWLVNQNNLLDNKNYFVIPSIPKEITIEVLSLKDRILDLERRFIGEIVTNQIKYQIRLGLQELFNEYGLNDLWYTLEDDGNGRISITGLRNIDKYALKGILEKENINMENQEKEINKTIGNLKYHLQEEFINLIKSFTTAGTYRTDFSIWLYLADMGLRLPKEVYDLWVERLNDDNNFSTSAKPTSETSRYIEPEILSKHNADLYAQHNIMEQPTDMEKTLRVIEENKKPKEVGITSHPNYPTLGIVIEEGKIPLPDSKTLTQLKFWQSTKDNPCWVEVSNNEKIWSKALFIADLGEHIANRYIVINQKLDWFFLNGDKNVGLTIIELDSFSYIREVQPEKKDFTFNCTEEEAQRLKEYLDSIR
jgi:hypothetical protein